MPVNDKVVNMPRRREELQPVFKGRDAECLWTIVKLNHRNRRTPSLEEIASEMGISKVQAMNYVERLETNKFISRKQGEGRRLGRSIEINFETILCLVSREQKPPSGLMAD